MPERHSSIPASPPPPEIGKELSNKISNCSFRTDKFQWANQYPEIQRACFFARICEDSRPKKCAVHQIEPILQNGPVCGLVCISMILKGSKNAEMLLNEARLSQYSNNGEMFSAYYLYKLLEKQNSNCAIYYNDGFLDSDLIKNKLKNNCMLLVPYDSDKNHSPCKLRGHKAHWCLIVGVLIDESDQFFVFARHGKTKNLALWSLKELSESNSNLQEFAQPNLHPNDVFLLPDGGIDGQLGLRNKCIIVEQLDELKTIEVVEL